MKIGAKNSKERKKSKKEQTTNKNTKEPKK